MITINLPAATIKTIVDIDNPKLISSIEDVRNKLETNAVYGESSIKSMWANPKSVGSFIEWNFFDLYINKITKLTCKNTVNDNNSNRVPLKYWELHLGFHDKKDISFLVPGFMRFFSKTTKSFVPIEFLKKTDLLVDYTGADIKMIKKEELTDYNIEGQDFYSILVSTDVNTPDTSYESQMYLNGVLAAAAYYNFENCF